MRHTACCRHCLPTHDICKLFAAFIAWQWPTYAKEELEHYWNCDIAINTSLKFYVKGYQAHFERFLKPCCFFFGVETVISLPWMSILGSIAFTPMLCSGNLDLATRSQTLCLLLITDSSSVRRQQKDANFNILYWIDFHTDLPYCTHLEFIAIPAQFAGS